MSLGFSSEVLRMKMSMSVVAYGRPGNNVTIRIPGRENPAAAIQSDTLKSIIDGIEEVLGLASTGNWQEALEELRGTRDFLDAIYNGLLEDISREGESIK